MVWFACGLWLLLWVCWFSVVVILLDLIEFGCVVYLVLFAMDFLCFAILLWVCLFVLVWVCLWDE